MKTIRLERMELRNFKGVEKAEYVFSGQTDISGANGSGKSTIYEAYLWCLFDKNAAGQKPKVQPLDENNKVMHQLTTAVRLELSVDGNLIIVERSLKEDWVKPRGTTELVLKGTKSEYAINEVPMSNAQYNAKLQDILPLDRWFLLSSIGIIPGMEQKACRAALQAIAPSIDEAALAAPFPYVADAQSKGLNIDELLAITKKTRMDSQRELDGIPAALDAQDRLRVTDDFGQAEHDLAEVNRALAENKAALEELQKTALDSASVAHMEEQRKALQDIERQIADREVKVKADYSRTQNTLLQKQYKLQMEADSIRVRIDYAGRAAKRCMDDIENYKAKIAALGKQWKQKNEETYAEPAMETVCPACGQPLPAEKVAEARAKASAEWNTRKVDALQKLQDEAASLRKLIGDCNADNERQMKQTTADNQRLAEIGAEVKALQQQLDGLVTSEQTLAADVSYQALCTKKRAMVAAIARETEEKSASEHEQKKHREIAEKNDAIRSLALTRDGLLRRLAGRDTNARIDSERKRLEERQRVLADAIAQAEGIEQEVSAYRKAKITAVEEGVSNLFTMVRWKMYEPNVTNDGEKEICQAIIDGVPYEQQNYATQVNAGVDIVNAFAKAYGVSTPLFIDNAESVTDILPFNGQRITLTVVPNGELTIN